MKTGLITGLCAVLLTVLTSTAQAQDDFEFHPALSDNFYLSVGAFRSDNSFGIAAGNNTDEIDFDGALGVEDSSTMVDAQLRWKFGKQRKWSLWGQYFVNDATGGGELEEDVAWQDVVFREGTFVGAGVKMAVTRVFVGRSFVLKPQHDFGLGVGLHILDLDTFIEGDLLIDENTTGFHRGTASKSQPLPNIGGWYNYSPAKKWLLHGRIDWISANIGDYDGTLWNVAVGVNYQAFRHVGFGLSYEYFNLDLKVDSDDWTGGVDMPYSGPVLSVTANW